MDGRIVYLLDSDSFGQAALAAPLRAEGFDVRAFPTATEFRAGFDPAAKSCLLLDFAFPEVGGLELQRQLITEQMCPPTVFLAGQTDPKDVVQAIRQGAVEFLQRPITPADAEQAVRKAFASLNPEKDKVAALTKAEREVLDLILTGERNKGMAEILNLSLRAIEDRRARLMRKLGVESVAELVRMALAAGIRPK
jgi:FixJ family two-component response regulator